MTKRQSSGIERTINPNRADDRPESTGESSGIEQTILPYRAGGTENILSKRVLYPNIICIFSKNNTQRKEDAGY